MEIFNRMQVNQIIDEFLQENEGLVELSESQIADTIDVYNSVMTEKVNATKTKDEQISLIHDILTGFSYNETKDRLLRAHSDVKFLNFFDNFLDEGESEKVYNAIKSRGLSTEILRGIKPNVDINIKMNSGKDVVEISGKINPSPDGDNDQDDFMEIKVNGNTIYRWTRDFTDFVDYDESHFEPDEHYEPEPIKAPKTKSGKPRKGIYLGTIITSSGDIITEEIMSNGRRVLRDSKGRFTKK